MNYFTIQLVTPYYANLNKSKKMAFFKFQGLITLMILSFLSFQTKGDTIKVELFFFDLCSQSVKELSFDLISEQKIYASKNSTVFVETTGSYILSTGIISGDYVGSHSEIVELVHSQDYIDTIEIPRIKLTTETALHSNYWNYFNCDTLCDGKQTDYYSNGNIRFSGIFQLGKPLEITEYRKNGTKEIRSFYNLGYITARRIEYYDETEKLQAYEIYKFRNGKTIIKTYDKGGKFIERCIEKY